MLEIYQQQLAELRQEFVKVCRSVFGDLLISIINKGSTVKGGFIPGLSDIDFHVYLKAEAFEFSDFLRYELGLRMQEQMDPLIRKYDFGGGPIQVNLLNEAKPPDWSGPLPDTYILLYGEPYPEPPPTAEELLEKDRENLLHPFAYRWVGTHADKTNDRLPDFIRSLNTQVTPTLFRLLSLLSQEPLRVWSMNKFEVIEELANRAEACAKRLAQLSREFYELAPQRERQQTDAEFCRRIIRLAFEVADLGRAFVLESEDLAVTASDTSV